MIIGKKRIEGTPDEIRDISKDFGFDFKKIFGFGGAPELVWLIVPVILFFTISVVIRTWTTLPLTVKNIFIIADIFLALWFTCSVHLRFDNKFITSWCAIISLIIIGVCSGFFGFEEAIKAALDRIR